jgi:hypothetical protein
MTAKTVATIADVVLKQIESTAEKEFLPIIGPYKGKFLAEEVEGLSRGMSYRLAL